MSRNKEGDEISVFRTVTSREGCVSRNDITAPEGVQTSGHIPRGMCE